MSAPAVSVIMPVYNAEKYLRAAIDSILQQTFTNFEFIIVNDCSTDGSEAIISSYTDDRIKLVKQQQNKGVVAAMNKGLEVAVAPFIAVMHADDISLPNRLELEYKYIYKNSNCAVLAGATVFIDEEGNPTGEIWKLDQQTKTAGEIRKTMVRENCITHSSVMMRVEIMKKYGYQSSPDHQGFAVEDYPLWLNVLSDDYEIHKLEEEVLLYRTHTNSATAKFLKKRNPFLVNYYTKKFYLETRRNSGSLNCFDRKISRTMVLDYAKSILKEVKKIIMNSKI
jgi:glycosyltransferase involved in cell wall biosynthesis